MPEVWSTGLCDCCGETGGFGNCLYTFCCSPCAFGDNVARMSPGAVCCGGSCYGACCGYYMLQALGGLGFIMHMGARSFLRQKYNLEGDGCQDCLLACFCTPCAMAQEHRELNIRGLGPGGVETKPPKAAVINQAPQMIVMQQHPSASPYPPPYNQPPPPPPGYGAPPAGYPQQPPSPQPAHYPQAPPSAPGYPPHPAAH